MNSLTDFHLDKRIYEVHMISYFSCLCCFEVPLTKNKMADSFQRQINFDVTFTMLTIFPFWPAERTGSSQFKQKGPRRARTFRPAKNFPNSRALADWSGRTERL